MSRHHSKQSVGQPPMMDYFGFGGGYSQTEYQHFHRSGNLAANGPLRDFFDRLMNPQHCTCSPERRHAFEYKSMHNGVDQTFHGHACPHYYVTPQMAASQWTASVKIPSAKDDTLAPSNDAFLAWNVVLQDRRKEDFAHADERIKAEYPRHAHSFLEVDQHDLGHIYDLDRQRVEPQFSLGRLIPNHEPVLSKSRNNTLLDDVISKIPGHWHEDRQPDSLAFHDIRECFVLTDKTRIASKQEDFDWQEGTETYKRIMSTSTHYCPEGCLPKGAADYWHLSRNPPEADGYVMLPPGFGYKPNLRHLGQRCLLHGANNVHNWCDEAINIADKLEYCSKSFLSWAKPIIDMTIRVCTKFPPMSRIFVTAITKDYATGQNYNLAAGFDGAIIYTDDLNIDYGRHWPNVFYIKSPLYVNGRTHSALRLLPGYVGKSDVTFVCANVQTTNLPRAYTEMFDVPLPHFTSSSYAWHPSNCSFLLSKGGALTKLHKGLALMEAFGPVYGVDEIMYLYEPYVNQLLQLSDRHRLNNAFSVAHTCSKIKYNVYFWEQGVKAAFTVLGYTRANMVTLANIERQLNNQPSVLPLNGLMDLRALNKRLGRLIITTGLEYQTPVWGPTSNDVPLKIGTITIFTFGTRGDQMPLIGLAEVLKAEGLFVHVHHCLTTEQGEEMLKAVEEGKSHTYVHWLNDAYDCVTSCQGIKFAPYVISDANTITYGLAPPSDVVRPLKGGIWAWAEPFVSAYFANTTNHINIGAYKRRGWLPRYIVDSFWQGQRNSGLYDKIVVKGSSSIPIPEMYRGWPVLQTGQDHRKVLPLYKNVAFIPTAGLSQTVALANCRAHAIDVTAFAGGAPDRRVRRLDDPAMKAYVDNSTDPRLILLALGLKHWCGFALYFDWHDLTTTSLLALPARLYRAVKWWPYTFQLGNVWLVFTILINCLWFKRSKIPESEHPIVTIIGFILLGNTPTWYDTYLILLLNYLWVWYRREHNLSMWSTTKSFIKKAVTARRHWTWALLRFWLPAPAVIFVSVWTIPILEAFKISLFKLLRAAFHIYVNNHGQGEVYLEFRAIFNGWAPLYHVALIAPSINMRYEGTYTDESGWGKLFRMCHFEGGRDPKAWSIPTALTIKEFKDLKPRSARYGLFWTCQTGLTHQLSNKLWKTGFPAAMFLTIFILGSFSFGFLLFLIAILIWILCLIPDNICGFNPVDVFPVLKSAYEDFDLDLGRPEGQTEGWIIGWYDWAANVLAQQGNSSRQAPPSVHPSDPRSAEDTDRIQEICDTIVSLPRFAGHHLVNFKPDDSDLRDHYLHSLPTPFDWPLVCERIADTIIDRFEGPYMAQLNKLRTETLEPLYACKYKWTLEYDAMYETAKDKLLTTFLPSETTIYLNDLEPRDLDLSPHNITDEEFDAFINVSEPWYDEENNAWRDFDWAVETKMREFTTTFTDYAITLMNSKSVNKIPEYEHDDDYTPIWQAIMWSRPHLGPNHTRKSPTYNEWYMQHRAYWIANIALPVAYFDAALAPCNSSKTLPELAGEVINHFKPKGLAAADLPTIKRYIGRDWSHIDSIIGEQNRLLEMLRGLYPSLESLVNYSETHDASLDSVAQWMRGNFPALELPTKIENDGNQVLEATDNVGLGCLINACNTVKRFATSCSEGSYETLTFYLDEYKIQEGRPVSSHKGYNDRYESQSMPVKMMIQILIPFQSKPNTVMPENMEEWINLGSALTADLISLGVNEHVAALTCGYTLRALTSNESKHAKYSNSTARVALLTGMIEKRPEGRLDIEFLLRQVIKLENFLARISFKSPLVRSVINLYSTVTLKLELILQLLGDLFNRVISYLIESGEALIHEAIIIFVDLLNGTAPDLSRSAKSVWAFLFPDTNPVLSPAEYFALSLPEMEFNESHDMWSQTESLVKRINQFAPDNKELSGELGSRPLRYPRRFRVAKEGELKGTEFTGEEIALPSWKLALDNYASRYQFKQGIDGAFFANAANEFASLSRYSGESLPIDERTRQLVLESADAMVEEFPSMFLNAKPSTVEAAFNNLVTKYSPRLPFLSTYKSIRDMYDDGFYRTIVNTAKSYLKEGKHPGELYDSFVKRQVVSREKAEGFIRTITAQDIISYAIALVPSLERNKRIPPREFRWGAGTPLTEGGLMDDALTLLEAERAGWKLFSADEQNYDANAHSVFMVDGLSRLAEHGFKTHVNGKALSSILKSHYQAMNKSWIYDLHHQFIIKKERGGATGEVSVSWDNTMTKMMKDMTCWSIVTGKSPKDFFKTNILLLTSDDELWASKDLSPDQIHEICDVSWTHFGQLTKIETVIGKLNQQEYLSKLFDTEVNSIDYQRYGLQVPGITIKTNPSRILMRRSAFRSDKGGRPDAEFYQYTMERTIGHASLLAHYPDLYTDLAREYMSDADKLLGNDGHNWRVNYNSDGAIVKIKLLPGRPKSSRHQELVTKLGRALKFPSYREVMVNWTKPATRKPQEFINQKLEKQELSPTLIHAMTVGLSVFRKHIRNTWVRDAVAKAQPEKEGANIASIFETREHWVERFIYRHAYLTLGRHVDAHEFQAFVRESPYACCCDALGFWLNLGNVHYRDKVMTDDLQELTNRMLIVSAFYIWYDILIEKGKYVPIFGFILELFHFWTRERTRLYSASNLIYWHGTGQSSTVISGLIPRDAYAVIKQLAAMSAETVPAWVIKWIPTTWALKAIPWATETYTKLQVWHETSLLPTSGLSEGFVNPWDTTVKELIDANNVRAPFHGLSAETSTGKSTAFIASLANHIDDKIWLIVPTETLRDEYSNIFLAPFSHQVLKQGIVLDSKVKLYVCTYGTYLVRKKMRECGSKCWVILDEPQEGTPEMILTWHYARFNPRLLLTATMRSEIYEGAKRLYVSPLKRKYKIDTYLVPGSINNLIAEAARYEDFRKRGLVLCNDLRTVSQIITSLQTMGLQATELSSRSPRIPGKGIIVATAVVNAGLNIYPPPTILVSVNTETISRKGKLIHQPCSQKTIEQQNGRVGRLKDGIVLRLAKPTIGEEPLPYPNIIRFLGDPEDNSVFTKVYKLNHHFTQPKHPISKDSVYRFTQIEGFNKHSATYASLAAYWAFACTTDNVRSALTSYDKWKNHIYDPYLTYIEELIRPYRGKALPTALVQERLEAKPFKLIINETAVRCTGIYLREDNVRTFDHTFIKSMKF